MEENDFITSKIAYLLSIERNAADRKRVEELTREQRSSDLWVEIRKKMLTASNFGKIVKLKPYTSCISTVENILYSKEIISKATQYGILNEATAINAIAKFLQTPIQKSGIYIDAEIPYLGATPDGVILNNGKVIAVVEVKCPYSAKDMTPEDGINKRLITFWRQNGTINKQHNWFYQIQGQMHICQVEKGYLGCWTNCGLKVEEICKDDHFWQTNMVEKLKRFYENCLLPELIDPRKERNMPIKDPQYIIEAQQERLKNKQSSSIKQ